MLHTPCPVRAAKPHGTLRKFSCTHNFNRSTTQGKNQMNTIIYVVGLVVIIGVILSYFGFR